MHRSTTWKPWADYSSNPQALFEQFFSHHPVFAFLYTDITHISYIRTLVKTLASIELLRLPAYLTFLVRAINQRLLIT